RGGPARSGRLERRKALRARRELGRGGFQRKPDRHPGSRRAERLGAAGGLRRGGRNALRARRDFAGRVLIFTVAMAGARSFTLRRWHSIWSSTLPAPARRTPRSCAAASTCGRYAGPRTAKSCAPTRETLVRLGFA